MLKKENPHPANEEEIRRYLSEKGKNVKIRTVQIIGSTNDEMKDLAIKGEEEISLLIAEEQTKGKGRKGRSFYSPKSTGIYMSFLVRPEYTIEECTLLTTMAAAVTAEAIQKVTEKETQIKWVNDVFMEKRKVAGILTECSVKKDRTGLDWAVVGIGVNISVPKEGFPKEIQDIAGAILTDETAFIKNRLIAEIINGFTENYYTLTERKYLKSYRERLFFLGNEITVIEGDTSYKATATDIDSMCHLIVKLPDGSQRILYGGEISVKVVSSREKSSK